MADTGGLVNGWREASLGDVLTLQRGFDLPARNRVDGSVPIVSSSGVTGWHDVAKAEPPGVVIGRYGSLGSVHWVTEPYWPLNTSLWVKDFKGNDPRYLSYLLSTISIDGSTASAVPGVNRNHLHRLPVHVPPVDAQRRIAAVLGTFDELIEINERRIELLEEIATSLYREWFVHFRFPRQEIGVSGPPFGGAPRSWTARRLSEITSQLSRGIAPRYAEDGLWTVLNQRCIRAQRVSLTPARRQERSVPEAKRVAYGDVLINSTGVGTLGRVAMFLLQLERVTADSHVTIVRARSPDLQPWLGLSLLARQPEFEAMGTGSTGQTELSRAEVGDLRLAVPDPETLARFSTVAWPLIAAVPHLAHQNLRLAATRDLLLPRLITGRLDVSDVDLDALLPADAA